MPNYQGVWSLSTQFQNRTGWPVQPLYGDIGIIGGGTSNEIQYVQISTLGDSADFGDLTAIRVKGRNSIFYTGLIWPSVFYTLADNLEFFS